MAAFADRSPLEGGSSLGLRKLGQRIGEYTRRETEHLPGQLAVGAAAEVATEPDTLTDVPIPSVIRWMTEAPENNFRFTPDQVDDLRTNHGAVRPLDQQL